MKLRNAERWSKTAQYCHGCCQNVLWGSIIFKGARARPSQKERAYVTTSLYYMGITTRAADKKQQQAEWLAGLCEWMSLFAAVEPWRWGDPSLRCGGPATTQLDLHVAQPKRFSSDLFPLALKSSPVSWILCVRFVAEKTSTLSVEPL